MANAAANRSRPAVTNFLRYPGSKRRMLAFLGNHLPTAESIQGRYVEPFVGSGAVFLYVAPKHALLSDINPDLVALYRGIRLDPRRVWSLYSGYGRTKAEFQRIRNAEPPRHVVERAARILFLNRTCFMGMWRTNQNGQFNVGYGGQARRWVIDEETLIEVRELLRRAKLRCGDFEPIINECVKGDFLFLDPPYCPGEKEQANDHYIGRQFAYEDHRRLADALRSAKTRGVRWMMTTSSHPDILKLFRGNSIITLPHGTGRRPGVLVDNSGEVLVASYSLTRETGK